MAPLLAIALAMARPHTIRLHESETAALHSAKVIDAEFQVIGRRTIWRRIRLALIAVFWAAAVGFAIPQIWIFAERIGAFFAAG
jgi:hypothetical protein